MQSCLSYHWRCYYAAKNLEYNLGALLHRYHILDDVDNTFLSLAHSQALEINQVDGNQDQLNSDEALRHFLARYQLSCPFVTGN